jgi:hypothetical protein
MTRKDYALIAGALRDVQPSIEAFHEYGVWQECVKRLAERLYTDSGTYDRNGNYRHRFDAAKFGAASGLIRRPDGSCWPIGSNPTTAQILG